MRRREVRSLVSVQGAARWRTGFAAVCRLSPRLPPVVLAALHALGTAGCDSGGTPADRTDGAAVAEWFVERTVEAGIDFVYESGATGKLYLPEIMGAGVGLLDYDNDGDLDLYLVNGNRNLPGAEPGGTVRNRLLRHDPGLRFVDVTAEAGVGDTGYGMGLAVGDIDNDGDVDLYVTNFGPDRLYLNRGDGTFQDVTEAAGVDVPGWSCSSAFLDYDRDGFLDLYVTQYVVWDAETECLNRVGQRNYCGPLAFHPAPDVLLRNNGDPASPSFTDVSKPAGIAAVTCAGLGVVCEDLDDDGWVDIYVANDAYANQLWINRRNGTFRDAALELGAAHNLHGQPEAGMGVLADDLTNRGRPDLFVTHLGGETNTLYRNEGPLAGFTDFTGSSGLGASSRRFTGFGTCGLDFDLDGDLDLIVVNGRVRRGDPWPTPNVGSHSHRDLFAEPNLVYLSEGDRFRLLGPEVRSLAERVEISRGLAMGDLDGDGDGDLILGNIESPARLYLNETPRRGRWLLVRARDPRLNRDAIGARITLDVGGRKLVRTVRRAFSYLSSSDVRVHFGLGAVDRAESLLVRWPDGLEERFAVDSVDCLVELKRGEGKTER